ncbi:hypothetical protein [Pedobacter miscanthi]|jgi:hypothetical protein|uniref:hypothetical protein n=1 Tax=Pedobacter miscanthi TaxID=2259170 RepID=UPI00292F15DD|nr:hypothetical protein [Pedobacter miscanthi]
MIKLVFAAIFNFLIVLSATAQQSQKQAKVCKGILLTRLTALKSPEGNEKDTSKILYVYNDSKDSLFVYKIAAGLLSEATAYSLTANGNSLYLRGKSILNGADNIELLKITFSDAEHTMFVNEQDKYWLYPEFYAQVKQQVGIKHSIIDFFDLLDDYLEDYAINDIYPVLLSTNGKRWNKNLQQSKITTGRSQSDLKDTWNYKYQYSRLGKLQSVKGTSAEETHFSKKISYLRPNLLEMAIYRNTEDRQIVSRKVSYNPLTLNLLKLTDRVEVTGKNTETLINATISRKVIAKLKSLQMSQSEVIRLVGLYK